MNFGQLLVFALIHVAYGKQLKFKSITPISQAYSKVVPNEKTCAKLVADSTRNELYAISLGKDGSDGRIRAYFTVYNTSSPEIKLVSSWNIASNIKIVGSECEAKFISESKSIQLISQEYGDIALFEFDNRGNINNQKFYQGNPTSQSAVQHTFAIWTSFNEIWLVLFPDDFISIARFDLQLNLIGTPKKVQVKSDSAVALEELPWALGRIVLWIKSSNGPNVPYFLNDTGSAYTMISILPQQNINKTVVSTKLFLLTNPNNDYLAAFDDGQWILSSGTTGEMIKQQTFRNETGLSIDSITTLDANREFFFMIEPGVFNGLTMFFACSLSKWAIYSLVIGQDSQVSGADLIYFPDKKYIFASVYFKTARYVGQTKYSDGFHLYQYQMTGVEDSPSTPLSPVETSIPTNVIKQVKHSGMIILPIGITVGVAALIIIMIGFLLSYRRRTKCIQNEAKLSQSHNSILRANDSMFKTNNQVDSKYSVFHTQTGSTETSITMAASMVLAIPAYLVISESQHLKKGPLIARGGSANIFMVDMIDAEMITRANGATQAVAKYLLAQYAQEKAILNQEISLMHFFHVKYPLYFPPLLGFDSTTGTIVMPFYQAGSLNSYLPTHTFNLKTIITILLSISRGVQAMHHEEIAHRDLKPDNILVDVSAADAIRPVITDLGLSKILNTDVLGVKAFEQASIEGFSLVYAAPDIIRQVRLRQWPTGALVWKAADVYSIGSIIFEVLVKKRPWQA